MQKIKFLRITLSVAIVFLVLVVLMPILPYKPTIGFDSLNYTKLKVKYSPQFGFMPREKHKNLNLEKGMELDNFFEIESLKKIGDEIKIFKYGIPVEKINIYGNIIENEDGNKKFYIKKWSSPEVMVIDTYIWNNKLESKYFYIVFPAIELIILCSIVLFKTNKNEFI